MEAAIVEVRDGRITLTPVKAVRQGWEEAVRLASARLADDYRLAAPMPCPPDMASADRGLAA